MRQDGIISAFVFVFVIAPFRSDGRTFSPVTPDIKKFLNTTDPIWSYMTNSMSTNYDCKVDVIGNIGSEDVHFRRFLAHRKVIVNDWVQYLVGHLYHRDARVRTNTQIFNAMNVSFQEQGAPLDTETLVFLSQDNTCGIFLVGDGVEGSTFELRVKNSSINAANSTECLKPYHDMAKKPAKVTYQPACHDTLIGIDNIVPGGSPDSGAIGSGFMLYNRHIFVPHPDFSFPPLGITAMFLSSWLT
uniref:Lipocalin n=1 Tax=Rhipicephalus zambeziensis TaxID=60191 RepID=A0A224YBQ9_9ACAR